VYEDRDTADPHYITELLSGIIHGCPDSAPAEVERIEKRVRNEILWYDANINKPWRRSPLWLVIRVALQTTLRRACTEGQVKYKTFMIFLLAYVVLSSKDCHSLATDLLVCMQNKIVRRLRKLGDTVTESLIERGTHVISKAKEILDARWKDLRSYQAASPEWLPESLNVTEDCKISLLSSKDYLTRRLQRPITSLNHPAFQPSEATRLKDVDFLRPSTVSAALTSDPFLMLRDIEQFATKRLDVWVERYSYDMSACIAFGECIIHYATSAQTKYKGNPEDQSLMLLTVFVLWSGLDQVAIAQHPKLADYSPEIPERLLDPILLRKSNSITVLIRLRSYLRTRHRDANRGSVFDQNLSSDSFAIRFFNSSRRLKQLKEKIEAKARDEREQKRREFARQKAKYERLLSSARSRTHECWESGYWNCTKCMLRAQASSLSIGVHEWPLPKDDLSARATVFELQCPWAFQSWRTTTYTIIYYVCSPNGFGGATAQATLSDYNGLFPYCQDQSRVQYGSSTNSFVSSHYSSTNIASVSSGLSSILVNNGLRWRLFDSNKRVWVTTESFDGCDIEKLCMFTVESSSPYHSVQYAMQWTTHSANKPIADQAVVPPELSIHEYLAYGVLHSGPRVQWLNILRELRSRTLSFECFEVHLLLTQAAIQTGSIDVAEEELQWHTVLKRPDFGLTLLSEIDDLLSSVESNWYHTNTVQTLTTLTTRLLAASLNEDVIARACSILCDGRKIAFTWVNSLTRDLQQADDEATITFLRQRVCLAATTCRAAYDVDPRYLSRLFVSDDDVKIFIQCAIQIQDNAPSSKIPVELSVFLAHDRRISQDLAPAILSRIQSSRAGLDNSILAIWSDYQVGSGWMQSDAPNEHWLTSRISDLTTATQSTVHYNPMDGTLLIDGKPLGRLPSSIVQHQTYIHLLGHLYFQLPGPDGNLIIQGKVGADIYELVPHTVFGRASRGDFPLSLIDGYAHWLRLLPASDSGHLTFHPLKSVWKPSNDNWQLDFTPGIGGGTMKTGGVVMRLKPLEFSHHIHVTLDTEAALLVGLPRFKLAFYVNENRDLDCSTIRDMVVDLHQSSGTMFGLTNQLVLQGKSLRTTRIAAPGSRRVIIPFGKVSFQGGRFHHSEVQILLDDEPLQKYFLYEVDTKLGRLTGTTLLSDIYKTYLHACTSFPLLDELTAHTGTEEALHQLESARFFSFQDLTSEETNLFQDITKLTGTMNWYPVNYASCYHSSGIV
ncbi:hypothetical protein DXG01_004169, partial [Tephrocybe rancida]